MTTKYNVDDLRIVGITEVLPPRQLHEEFPITTAAAKTVVSTRRAVHRILTGQDDRLLIIVGPCSIHDPKAAREYAGRLAEMREELGEDLLIVMRVYFEKPRTTVGWKGLINDPALDGSFQINEGLRLARSLLLDINNAGVPAATEYLDLITPQYVADLISWGAIGARTTESQVHRELASGMSCAVGFKNNTDGTFRIAIDAIRAASQPHVFLSLTKEGKSAIFSTTGNEDAHIILRGGKEPNYHAASVAEAVADLEAAGMPPRLMIDFSHANSQKKPERQIDVGHDVAAQIAAGNRAIIGAMVESHLIGGRQDVKKGKELTYGQSVTDACIGWDDTTPLLRDLARAVRERRTRDEGGASTESD
ncbi:MAG: 3-deoxy-7-phosphoheptulonate synthase AroG [Chromatiales bacterium]|nr:3-deoxy-7-phosphoheptulonate synthase AroG [Chromatiales bacterium]